MKKRISKLVIGLVLIFGLFLTGCKEELELLKGTWYCDNQITLNFTELIEYKHGDLKWWAIYGGQIDNNSTCFLNNSVFFCLMGRDISETFMYKYYTYNVVQKVGLLENFRDQQAEKDLNNDEALFLAGKASSHCRLQYNDTDEQVINKICYCINKGRE